MEAGAAHTLPAPAVRQALQHLDLRAERPTLPALNRLLHAYTHSVPWESASRIAKQRATPDLARRPRWPEEFWDEAIRRGSGGTCFESNYAFFALLRALGYEGHLTINDMGSTVGCHTACVVTLPNGRYVVDVGFPLHRALPLDADPAHEHYVYTRLRSYWVQPVAPHRYRIDFNGLHKRNAFTLIDEPVAEDAYCAATTRDYDVAGLFLDKVIIQKFRDGRTWRFTSHERPYHLFAFNRSRRAEYTLAEHDAPAALADCFGMDVELIRAALAAVG